MLELKNISYFYKSQKDKMVLEQIPYQFENGKMYTALDERIREALMKEAERFSVPDDLKDKIMKMILKNKKMICLLLEYYVFFLMGLLH